MAHFQVAFDISSMPDHLRHALNDSKSLCDATLELKLFFREQIANGKFSIRSESTDGMTEEEMIRFVVGQLGLDN